MSAGFAKAAQASSKFYNKLNNNQNKFISNSKRVPANIAQLEKHLSRLSHKRDNAFDVKSIKRYNIQIRKTEKQLNKLSNLPSLSIRDRFSKLKSQMGGVLGLAGGLAIGMAAFGAGKGIIKLGADLEQTRVSFQTMLGSADKGNKLLKDINEFANVTPFANSDLQDSAKVLLNFGVTGEKVIPTLKNIGDVSGGNKEKLRGLTLAFAQVSSAGKLQGQDLMQMINAGFNPLMEISRTTGESMASLKDKMAKGALSAQMVEQAFASATSEGGMFNGMMDKQSQTLSGKWSTLVGKFQDKIANFGEKMAPYLGKVVDFAIGVIDNVGKIPKVFRDVWKWIKNNLDIVIPLGVAIGSLTIALTASAIAAKAQSVWLGIVTTAQWALNVALNANPIGLIVAGIAALIAVVIVIIKYWKDWKSVMALFMGPFGVVIRMVDTFKRHWQKISDAFSGEGMLAGIKAIGVMLIDFMLEPLQGILELAAKIPGLGYLAEKGAEKIKDLRRGMGIDVQDNSPGTNMGILDKFNMGIAHLNALPLSVAEKLSAFTKKISSLDMPESLRKKAVQEAKKRFLLFESNKKKNADGTAIDPNVNPTDTFNKVNQTNESIVTGGKKQFVLTVNIEKVLETVNQTITNGEQQAEELVDTILDNLTRRLSGSLRSVGQ
jgi:tape measure domain-containing protein